MNNANIMMFDYSGKPFCLLLANILGFPLPFLLDLWLFSFFLPFLFPIPFSSSLLSVNKIGFIPFPPFSFLASSFHPTPFVVDALCFPKPNEVSLVF